MHQFFFWVKDVLYNWISQFKISCTKLLYEEEIHFWDFVTLMCKPSLRKVCQGVPGSLIGNKKVTDVPTDIYKAICPLSLEGKHKNTE